jgi:hypothetical protein
MQYAADMASGDLQISSFMTIDSGIQVIVRSQHQQLEKC